MILNLGESCKYLYMCYLCSESHSSCIRIFWPHALYSPGIIQARIMEEAAFPFSGIFNFRITHVSASGHS